MHEYKYSKKVNPVSKYVYGVETNFLWRLKIYWWFRENIQEVQKIVSRDFRISSWFKRMCNNFQINILLIAEQTMILNKLFLNYFTSLIF
jgi:hypothetical protein